MDRRVDRLGSAPIPPAAHGDIAGKSVLSQVAGVGLAPSFVKSSVFADIVGKNAVSPGVTAALGAFGDIAGKSVLSQVAGVGLAPSFVKSSVFADIVGKRALTPISPAHLHGFSAVAAVEVEHLPPILNGDLLLWLRQLARSVVLVGGPILAIEFFLITWSVVTDKGAGARQLFFELLAILGLLLTINPIFKKIANKLDEK